MGHIGHFDITQHPHIGKKSHLLQGMILVLLGGLLVGGSFYLKENTIDALGSIQTILTNYGTRWLFIVAGVLLILYGLFKGFFQKFSYTEIATGIILKNDSICFDGEHKDIVSTMIQKEIGGLEQVPFYRHVFGEEALYLYVRWHKDANLVAVKLNQYKTPITPWKVVENQQFVQSIKIIMQEIERRRSEG